MNAIRETIAANVANHEGDVDHRRLKILADAITAIRSASMGAVSESEMAHLRALLSDLRTLYSIDLRRL